MIARRPRATPDEAYVLAALNGVRAHHWDFGDMPLIADLTESDTARITAYIPENQRTQGFEAYPT